MKYHIVASKEIKECKCTSCRAKYGSFSSKSAANAALKALKDPTVQKTTSPAHKTQPKKAAASKGKAVKVEEKPLEEIFSDLAEEDKKLEEENADRYEPIEVIGSPISRKSRKIKAPVASVDQESNYFDDDEDFLKAEDKIISEDDLSVILQQVEGTVRADIYNLYDENGKLRNKFALRADPALFVIESMPSGDFAEFVVSRDMAKVLSRKFDDIYRAYYGLEPKGKFESVNPSKALNGFSSWVTGNPVKAGFGVLVILFLLVTIFFL